MIALEGRDLAPGDLALAQGHLGRYNWGTATMDNGSV